MMGFVAEFVTPFRRYVNLAALAEQFALLPQKLIHGFDHIPYLSPPCTLKSIASHNCLTGLAFWSG